MIGDSPPLSSSNMTRAQHENGLADGLLDTILRGALGASNLPAVLTSETQLLGFIPEMDSMSLLAILTQLEEELGVQIDDADVDASAFETVGTLRQFVQEQIAKQ